MESWEFSFAGVEITAGVKWTNFSRLLARGIKILIWIAWSTWENGNNFKLSLEFFRESFLLTDFHNFFLDMYHYLVAGLVLLSTTNCLADKPSSDYGAPAEPSIKYGGPIVYSGEKPPIIHFPPPPTDVSITFLHWWESTFSHVE